MAEVTFADKFIGFVDLLGFKSLVRSSEEGRGYPLNEILTALGDLGSAETRRRYLLRGPGICPRSKFNAKDLDFQITQVSDCVVVSTEISPAGAINLVSHCWQACLGLLTRGIMCRGYITRGSIYHTEDQVVGSGFSEATEREKQVSAFKQKADESGTPFIEVDHAVECYIEDEGDKCVKEMYGRMTRKDGELTVLFPFKRLNHSFIVAGLGKFDAEENLQSVRNVKQWIRGFKDKVASLIDQTNPNAINKGNHYIRILDAQLEECDKTERLIVMLAGKPSS